MIVGKAVNLAHDMGINVLGLIENMSYFKCDKCDKKHYIFGDPQGETVARRYQIPAHAELPIDPLIAQLVDQGKIAEYDLEGALDSITAQIRAL